MIISELNYLEVAGKESNVVRGSFLSSGQLYYNHQGHIQQFHDIIRQESVYSNVINVGHYATARADAKAFGDGSYSDLFLMAYTDSTIGYSSSSGHAVATSNKHYYGLYPAPAFPEPALEQ